MFKIEKYTEISATLPAPQKASGSVLKTMWSFNSSKNKIFYPATDCGSLEGKLSKDIVFLVRYP